MNLSIQMIYCQQLISKGKCCHLFYKTADPKMKVKVECYMLSSVLQNNS